MHAPATGLFSDTCMISPVCHTCAKLFLAVDRCICHFVIFLSTQVNLFQISRPIHIILKSNEMFVNNTFRLQTQTGTKCCRVSFRRRNAPCYQVRLLHLTFLPFLLLFVFSSFSLFVRFFFFSSFSFVREACCH